MTFICICLSKVLSELLSCQISLFCSSYHPNCFICLNCLSYIESTLFQVPKLLSVPELPELQYTKSELFQVPEKSYLPELPELAKTVSNTT